ncbi:palmitoyltransferase ZDHHC18-B-like isoform X1 [Stigmatopora nigra]
MKKGDRQQSEPMRSGTLTPVSAAQPPRAQTETRARDRYGGQSPTRAKKRWEVFPGKNRFFCDGRLMTAPQSGMLPLTLGLILVTSGLFFIFDCPFLVENLTGCIPAIGAILLGFVVFTLFQTTFSDPGILPRATADEVVDVEKQIDNASSASCRSAPRTKEVLINQQVVKLKYCFTCKMFRPPRTSHCGLCDNCVERFDHHCPWVGNCVGKRNYRFFYAFITSLSFLTAFIFCSVATHLVLSKEAAVWPRLVLFFFSSLRSNFLFQGPAMGKACLLPSKKAPGDILCSRRGSFWMWLGRRCVFLDRRLCTAVELCVCFFSVWCILGLSGFHTYLLASNLTTNEDIKGTWSGKSGANVTNPYSHKNIFVNCASILCEPMPPSLINGRAPVRTQPVRTAAKNGTDAPKSRGKSLPSAPSGEGRPLPAAPPSSARKSSAKPDSALDAPPTRGSRSSGGLLPPDTARVRPAKTNSGKSRTRSPAPIPDLYASRRGRTEEA